MSQQATALYFTLGKPEPVFHENKQASLHIAADVENSDGFRHYMVSMLRRHPQNLKRHVQYIMALIENKSRDYETLFAAVCDLFIVLENKGLPLRRRMLAMARPYLRHEDVVFLHNSLVAGINGFTHLRQGNRSALTRACSGECSFIKKIEIRQNSAFTSLYEEAMSLLDYGDIKEAQALLEKALRMQPDDEKTAAELVAIYEHSNDAESLAGMGQWYITNNLPLPSCWPLL